MDTGTADDSATRAKSEFVQGVCDRIARGVSVDAAFRDPGDGWFSEPTFWRAIAADKDLRQRYLDACAARGLIYAEQGTAILDEPPQYTATAFGNKIDPAWVQLQKLRSDDRKWHAARMQPKLYGDRTILAGDADNPIAIDDSSSIASRLLPELAAGSPAGTAGDADES